MNTSLNSVFYLAPYIQMKTNKHPKKLINCKNQSIDNFYLMQKFLSQTKLLARYWFNDLKNARISNRDIIRFRLFLILSIILSNKFYKDG